MQLRFFVFDWESQLQRVARDQIEAFWKGTSRADELPCEIGDELRLITVLCDERLLPKISFFTRVEVHDGEITDESRMVAYEAVSSRRRNRHDHPAAQQQLVGWPADWQHQLAVAMDVPQAEFRTVGLGGPLLMSDLWGISIDQVLQYFEMATKGTDWL